MIWGTTFHICESVQKRSEENRNIHARKTLYNGTPEPRILIMYLNLKKMYQENLSLTDLNGIGWRRLFSLVIQLCSKTLRDLHVRLKMDIRSIWS